MWLQGAAEDPLPFMVVQDKIALFYCMREVAGLVFFVVLVVYLSKEVSNESELRESAHDNRWGRLHSV